MSMCILLAIISLKIVLYPNNYGHKKVKVINLLK